MTLGGIGHEPGVGHDHRVDPKLGGAIHRRGPVCPVGGLGEGVEGQQHLAPPGMGVGDALAQARRVEVEPGEVAGVGGVLEAEIDGIGAMVDGGF